MLNYTGIIIIKHSKKFLTNLALFCFLRSLSFGNMFLSLKKEAKNRIKLLMLVLLSGGVYLLWRSSVDSMSVLRGRVP